MVRFDRDDIELLADYFFEHFRKHFIISKSGRPMEQATIEVSKKMTSKIGLALLFENKIKLNESYFLEHPHYLPYTMFHEMTHLWLYQSGHDPGHTKKFYQKMLDFPQTGFLVDPEIHVHTKLSDDSRFIYECKNCNNRWHLKDQLDHEIFCGLCWKREKERYFAELSHILPEYNLGEELDCA